MDDSGRTMADRMWSELERRLMVRFEEMGATCAYEPHELAESVAGVVRDWLMENAQLMIQVGKYEDPALGGKTERAGHQIGDMDKDKDGLRYYHPAEAGQDE